MEKWYGLRLLPMPDIIKKKESTLRYIFKTRVLPIHALVSIFRIRRLRSNDEFSPRHLIADWM